ncbi:hypothetical protein [Fulvivirga imtechensis]|nr:hypothetical protein [Fulvivirga imtechensis]
MRFFKPGTLPDGVGGDDFLFQSSTIPRSRHPGRNRVEIRDLPATGGV